MSAITLKRMAMSVSAALNFLRPKASPVPLVRFGGTGDGAYLVPDDLDGVLACFSPGVNNVKAFEDQLVSERGIRCHLCDFSSDVESMMTELIPDQQTFRKAWLDVEGTPDSITLERWVSELEPDSESDLLLQMDIEGAEYRNLLSTPDHILKRFRVIVIEIHDLTDLLDEERAAEKLLPLLELLDRHFVCVHAHPNNCCGEVIHPDSGMNLPAVIELTLLRRDRLTMREGHNFVPPTLPHVLDIPWNVPGNRPLFLNEQWFDGPRSVESELVKSNVMLASLADEIDRLKIELMGTVRQSLWRFELSRVNDIAPPGRRDIDVELAAGRPYRLTSAYEGGAREGIVSERDPFLFHTGFGVQQGITIDLGDGASVSEVELRNRTNMCLDRANFLIIERHDTPEPSLQGGWPVNSTADFLATAGVTLRVPLPVVQARYLTVFSISGTALHLSAVRVWGQRSDSV